MKRLALIVGVLMGIAPVTQAQPDDRRVDEGPRRGDLVPLVAMDIQRKQTVDIGRDAGGFRGLRLQALRGAAYVDFVTIRFDNGEQQHVDIRRRIGRDETVDVPFGPAQRYVAAITVHGQPDRWSQIQIIGMR